MLEVPMAYEMRGCNALLTPSRFRCCDLDCGYSTLDFCQRIVPFCCIMVKDEMTSSLRSAKDRQVYISNIQALPGSEHYPHPSLDDLCAVAPTKREWHWPSNNHQRQSERIARF